MRIGRAAIAVVITAAGALSAAAPVSAAVLACGTTITEDTTLDADVGPCAGDGVIIATEGVTLDLGGHTIFGSAEVGDGAGVLVLNAHGVKVTNGTVRGFDGGVVIQGGGFNAVTGITARDNIGHSEGHPPAPGTRYGDGIAVLGSSDNRIADNTVVNNGPFAGIGLYENPDADHPFPAAPTERNAVMDNLVQDNQFCRVNRNTGARFCDNDGIRVEPRVGPGNAIMGNTVRRNGLDGIAVFSDADENAVMRNVVEGNGFWGAVAGDGIRIFGRSNDVHQNTSTGNAAAGISVGRRTGAAMGSLPNNATTGNPRGRMNTFVRNTATGNVRFDLWDSNPCGVNTWRRNVFHTGAYCVQ